MLKQHRGDSALWPDSLKHWWVAKGGFVANEHLTRPLLMEWLATQTQWPELTKLGYQQKYSRMEHWAIVTTEKEQNGIADVVVMAAMERAKFLTLPNKKGDRIPATMQSMIKVLRGDRDPDQPQ